MSDEKLRGQAIAAAHQACSAAGELIRYAHEGPNWPAPFGHVELIELLADATKISLELLDAEAAGLDEQQGQLLGACVRFLEGWAG